MGKYPYTGTFDGGGHTIKNLSIDNTERYVGLFGYVYGGTIRNLTVSSSVKGSGHTDGIVGGVEGGTFENCANLCAVQNYSTEGGTTGGIIGFAHNLDYELIVRDCYNVGSITSRNAGGIIGQCSWNETISNCYNFGKVTGTASAGATIGIYYSDKISNCYYLDGSVSVAGKGDKASIAKSAAEFADGTVLTLLINDRAENDHPWAAECKYFAASGTRRCRYSKAKEMNIPVRATNGKPTKRITGRCAAALLCLIKRHIAARRPAPKMATLNTGTAKTAANTTPMREPKKSLLKKK